MKIICRKQGRALVPVDDEGIEALAKVKDGRDVTVEFKMARNPRHHRLMFAAFNFVKMHSPLMAGTLVDDIKEIIKFAVGHVRRLVDADTGQAFYVTRSIA